MTPGPLEADAAALPGDIIPAGFCGIDAGLTLTKLAARPDGGLLLRAVGAGDPLPQADAGVVGVTGARFRSLSVDKAVHVPEIEAAARGARALAALDGDDFVLALVGTGTAFALVRGASVTHLGGTALGGGSWRGLATRLAPGLSYDQLVAAAARGDRRRADLMVADAYPEGIGRIGADLTAAHLARTDGASPDDVLAGLMNLHGENIAQIAASRARMSSQACILICGGFVHGNAALTESIIAMCAMFGVQAQVAPAPGYAGAVGAALVAAEQRGG